MVGKFVLVSKKQNFAFWPKEQNKTDGIPHKLCVEDKQF